MARISSVLREQVIHRAKGRCEYCQTPQAIVIEMQIDHIVPESVGGLTILDNLCLACVGCNQHKGDHQTELDPQSKIFIPLFNPRTQIWSEQFVWDTTGTILVGLTATGRATIERLKINRAVVVQARERWVKAGWHPPKAD